MTSIVIGGIGSAVATGIVTSGSEIIRGVIGQDRSFIGHRQVILVLEDPMGNRVDQDFADPTTNRGDQVEAALIRRFMDHKAK